MPLNIQQKVALNQPLNNERVKHRTGGGGMQLNYLAGYDVIATANELFGFGEWGYDLLAVDLINVMAENSELVGGYYAARLRLTVRDCMPITEEGVCAISGGRNPKALVDAHDMARKGAITDALKRAFRCYGEQFGNSLYDKEYDARVSHSDDNPRQQQGQNRVQAPQGARPSVLPPTTQNAPQTATQPVQERITKLQLAAIKKMQETLRLSDKEMEERSNNLFGVDLIDISKKEADALITSMTKKVQTEQPQQSLTGTTGPDAPNGQTESWCQECAGPAIWDSGISREKGPWGGYFCQNTKCKKVQWVNFKGVK